jgi:hypothetical protein
MELAVAFYDHAIALILDEPSTELRNQGTDDGTRRDRAEAMKTEKIWRARVLDKFVPTQQRPRAFAYVFPPELTGLTGKLIEADNRKLWIVGLLIQVENDLHSCQKVGV